MDTSQLFGEFLKEAVIADRSFGRGFDRGSRGMSGRVFKAGYAPIERFLKEVLHVGIFGRGKYFSNFRNIYYAGSLLSAMACIKASEGRGR